MVIHNFVIVNGTLTYSLNVYLAIRNFDLSNVQLNT